MSVKCLKTWYFESIKIISQLFLNAPPTLNYSLKEIRLYHCGSDKSIAQLATIIPLLKSFSIVYPNISYRGFKAIADSICKAAVESRCVLQSFQLSGNIDGTSIGEIAKVAPCIKSLQISNEHIIKKNITFRFKLLAKSICTATEEGKNRLKGLYPNFVCIKALTQVSK